MTYTEAADFSAIEREAWSVGNEELASLAATADDLTAEWDQDREALEKDRDAEYDRAEAAQDAMRTMQADVQRALEAVDVVLAQCKRISKRAELEAALQDAYNATTGD